MQAESVRITVLMDNWVDMLLADVDLGRGAVARNGLFEHFDTRRVRPIAENGLSLLVEGWAGSTRTVVLFDAGLTGEALEHNLRALAVDADAIDYLVISHGHPDHYGGVYALLERRSHPLTVVTHEEAFLPRFAVMPNGKVAGNYNAVFDEQRLVAAGAHLVCTADPLVLGGGITTSGFIPRVSSFEGPPAEAEWLTPGLWQVRDRSRWQVDQVNDEQALYIDVADVGLVTLTGCAHAGVVNTLYRGRELFGDRPHAMVMGGFHLGFPTTPADNVRLTVEELQRLGAEVVMPMHCSGLPGHVAFSRSETGQYVQPAVGTVIGFNMEGRA